MTKKRPYKKRAKKNEPVDEKKVVEKVKVEATEETIDEKTKEIFAPEVEKVEEKEVNPVKKVEKPEKIDDSALPNKDFFRIDEVARYFDVSDRTVRMWIDHGHFETERLGGTIIRVLRDSVLRFRLKSRVDIV